MYRCKQCGHPLDSDFVRLDAGLRLATGERVAHDVNLHKASCFGDYMTAHYPWLVQTRDRTRID